ncbi:MAG: glycosyltransferase [Kiritimatiellae bacterium]|nr:glycosyltransferase [Kiritimatiellia bacterium]
MKLSVIILSLDGHPRVTRAFLAHPEVEVVDVTGVRPVGKARNEGLERAHGDYIAWIDGDDEVTEDYLPSILGAIDGNRPDAIVFGFEWRMGETSRFPKIWGGGDFTRAILRNTDVDFYSGLCNKVFSRKVWDGVSFDDSARTAEDWEVLPELAVKTENVVNIKRSLYLYLHNPGSLTTATDFALRLDGQRRHLARIDKARELGVYRKYRTDIIAGVANQLYHTAEFVRFYMDRTDPNARLLEIGAVSFIRRNLPFLMFSGERIRLKVKWLLAATGLWKVVELYYRRRDGAQAMRFAGPIIEKSKNPSPVHVVFAADEKYRPALEVAKSTMLASCSDPSRLVIHEFDARALDNIDTSGLRPWNGSFMPYLRLFLPGLLPDVDTVVYSDVDTIWNRDVLELGALADPSVSAQWVHDFESVARSPGYGCAGVCILNLRKLRERGFVGEVRRYFAQNPNPRFPDQDALNDILKDDFLLLSPVWNDMGNIMNLPPRGEKSVWHITGIGRCLDKPDIAWPPQYALWHKVRERLTGNGVECCQCGNVANSNTQYQLKIGNIGTGNNGDIQHRSLFPFRGKLFERVGRNLYFAKILSDYLSEHRQ